MSYSRAGNRALHEITTAEPHEMRVDIEDFGGQHVYAKYNNFSIGSESDNFTLTIDPDGYSGTAGDNSSMSLYT